MKTTIKTPYGTFDKENGCFQHKGDILTSWFREGLEHEPEWVPLEWAIFDHKLCSLICKYINQKES